MPLHQREVIADAGARAATERDMMGIVRSSLARVVTLSLRDAARELVRVMIEAHRLEPKLHRVLVEQIPRVGKMELVERVDEEAEQLVRAYLEVHRDELGVSDLDLAAVLVVGCVESMTHVAVLRRPALLDDPRFVDEVAGMVVRYLEGEREEANASRSSEPRPAMLAAR